MLMTLGKMSCDFGYCYNDSISCKDKGTRLATTDFIRSTLGEHLLKKFVGEVENYIYQIDKNGVKTAVLDKFEYFGLEAIRKTLCVKYALARFF